MKWESREARPDLVPPPSPWWAPPLVGGGLALLLSGGRMLAAFGGARSREEALPVLVVAALAGMAGGLVWALAERTLSHRGRRGRAAAGILAVAGFLGAVLGGAAIIGRPVVPLNAVSIITFAAMAIVYGTVMARHGFSDPPGSDLSWAPERARRGRGGVAGSMDPRSRSTVDAGTATNQAPRSPRSRRRG